MILWLYLSNFTSEHTAELGLGQGIRMLGWLGTKVSFVEIKAKVRSNLRRCWYLGGVYVFNTGTVTFGTYIFGIPQQHVLIAKRYATYLRIIFICFVVLLM